MDLRDCIKKTATKAVITVLTAITVIYLLWFFPVEHALNKYFNAQKLENYLDNTTSFNSIINNLTYGTNWDFTISIKTDNIKIFDDNAEIINIKKLSTRINPFPLAFNRLSIRSFDSDSFNLKIIKDKNGEINILNLLKKKNDKTTLPKIKALKLNIKKYNITYNDQKANETISLDGNNFIIQDYKRKKHIQLETNGILNHPSQKNKNNAKYQVQINSNLPIKKNLNKKNFIFNADIENLNLNIFSSIIKEIKTSKITKLDGLINANIKTHFVEDSQTKKLIGAITTKNLLLKATKPENSTELKELTNINFDTSLLKNKIIINTSDLKNKYQKIDATGEIVHSNTSKPTILLKLKLHNDRQCMIYNAIPSEISFEKSIIAKIKKYKPIATIDGEIELKGDISTPEITGEIDVKNLQINNPETKDAKSNVKVIFNKKRLQILGEVEPNKDAIVKVDGSLNIYGEKNALFKIFAPKEVNLTTVKALLMPIQDIFRLNFGILNQINIKSGRGLGELEISGSKKNAIINGNLNFKSAQASLDGISATLNNTDGYLQFKGKIVDFETTFAKAKDAQVKIKGSSDLFGNFNVNISSPSIKTEDLIEILKNSELLKPAKDKFTALKHLKQIKGKTQISLDIKGGEAGKTKIDVSKIDYTGELKLTNNELLINQLQYPIKISNAHSTFDPNSVKTILNAKILNSPINIDTVINDKIYLTATSDKFLLLDLLTLADKNNYYKKLFTQIKNQSFTKFKTTYSSDVNEFDPKKLNISAQLLSDGIAPFYTSQGLFSLNNANAKIENLNLNLLNAKIAIDGTIQEVFDKFPKYDIDYELTNFDISNLNTTPFYKLINEDAQKIISAYEKYQGKINGKLNHKNNNLTGQLQVQDLAFTHKRMQLPISVSNTNIIFKGSTINIPTIHASVDNIPVLIKLDILDYFKKPTYSGYITTNLYSSFINKYINPNLGYPIKLKGEMQVKSYFNGNSDETKTITLINLPVNSDISYMGASLDDKEFEREIKIDLTQKQNKFKINNSTLSKYIRAQNGARIKYPYVSANGHITVLPNDLTFNNFNIKTHEPTNSKIFNILFKKSILKYGKFDCNLNINGNYTEPKLSGFINFKNLDMPLYETIVKDIFATFKQNSLDLKILGSVYDTKLTATANLENNILAPYHIKNLNINADYLDLDNIFNSLSTVSMKRQLEISENQQTETSDKLSSSSILIDKGTVSAKKVLIKSFPATDLNAHLTQGIDGILKINNIDFKFAQGYFNANGQYDFNTNTLKGDCTVKEIDANQFSQIFLNLKNQIYGNLDGKVNFSTKGTNPTERIKNLNGKIEFKITDGKMPKLGSLEYLLRAANLVKSGITGFTINNMIDLLIPVKTGDFSLITGDIILENGIAKNIELSSTGKNLSLYITGTADIESQNTKMIVLGRLSKKLSTILGPIGNTSLNTLFNFIPGTSVSKSENQLVKELNKIPFLELSSNNDFRFFQATIDGDINGENFVQTFKWLE